MLEHYGYTLDNCWDDLKPAVQQVLQWGSGEEKFKFLYENLQGEIRQHQTSLGRHHSFAEAPLPGSFLGQHAPGPGNFYERQYLSGLPRHPFET
jgi:hypothetical protein